MPLLSGEILAAGAVVDVLAGVPESRKRLLQKHGFATPPPVHVRALLDTGSFLTGLHPRVFTALDLRSFDQIEIVTPSTAPNAPFRVPRYWVNLSLVADGQSCPMPDRFVFATDSWHPREGVEALIGMDILSQCFQLLGPDRRFTLAF